MATVGQSYKERGRGFILSPSLSISRPNGHGNRQHAGVVLQKASSISSLSLLLLLHGISLCLSESLLSLIPRPPSSSPRHLPLSSSFSLSKPIPSLSLFKLRPSVIRACGCPTSNTRLLGTFRGYRNGMTQLGCHWKAAVWESWGACGWPRLAAVVQPSPTIVDCGSWSPQVCLDSLVVMVPSVQDESGRIYNHAFRGKLSKLWQLIRVKRGLILISQIFNHGEKSFPMIYNMPIFEVVFSKSHFSRQLEIINLTIVLFCVQSQSGLEISKWDHLWTRLDTTNAMVASEFWNESLLEIMFFEVSSLSRFS